MSLRSPRVGILSVACLGLALLAGWGLAKQGNGEKSPARLLPAETVLYLRIDGAQGHEAAFEKTAAYQALYESGLMDVFDRAIEAISRLDQASNYVVAFQHLRQHGLSIAIAVDPPQPGPLLAWGTAVVPQGGEGVDLLADLIKSVPDLHIDIQSRRIQGRQVRWFAVPDAPLEVGWWAEGNDLVVAFGMNAVANAIDVADGNRKNISGHPLYERYSQIDPEFDVTQVCWFDFQSLREMFADIPLPVPNPGRGAVPVSDVLQRLGLQTLQHVAAVSGYREDSLWTEMLVEAPGERTGLMSLIDQPHFKLEDLPAMPLQHAGIFVRSCDWRAAYGTILEVVKAVAELGPPDAQAQIDAALASAEQELGFPLKDLFFSLGNIHCLYGDTSQGSFGTGLVGLVSVTDADQLAGCLEKILARVAQEVNKQQPGTMLVQQYDKLERRMFRVEFPQFPLFSPTLAVDADWLTIGLIPQSVEGQILRMDGVTYRWAVEEDLADTLEQLPEDMTSLSVVDPADMYQTLLSAAPMLMSFAEMGMRQSGQFPPGARLPIAAADLPPTELVTAPLFPNVTVSMTDEDGAHVYSRKSVAGLPLIGGGGDSGSLATASILVALLLPAVQQSREAARRSISQGHLKQIGLGLHNYHDTFNHFPEGTVPNDQLPPEKRLSWMVSLLPYMEEVSLHKQIHLQSGWEAPDNLAALSQAVPTFQNPSQPNRGTGPYAVTHYVGIGGLGADGPMLPVTDKRAGMFAYNRSTSIRDVKDGLSNTVILSDVSRDIGPWGAGGKATIRAFTRKPYLNGPDGIGSPHLGGVQMLMGDGAVRFVSDRIDPAVMEALATINGGESLGDF